jgi:hypothetical protein
MGSDSSRTSLPAPYRNPWRALGDDLRAVLADLRLRLQELWRRNGEGSLGRPLWWPRDLAPLFWPLLLAAGLALLVAAGVGVARLAPLQAPPPLAEPELGSTSELLEAESPPAPPLEQAPEQPPERRPEQAREPALEPAPELAQEPQPEPEPESESVAPDPLQELLARPEAQDLLKAAEADPARSTLRLLVKPAFLGLPAAHQQRWAEQWQPLAQELGYEHLELRDVSAGLVARDVLVGSGMIVLSSHGQG